VPIYPPVPDPNALLTLDELDFFGIGPSRAPTGSDDNDDDDDEEEVNDDEEMEDDELLARPFLLPCVFSLFGALMLKGEKIVIYIIFYFCSVLWSRVVRVMVVVCTRTFLYVACKTFMDLNLIYVSIYVCMVEYYSYLSMYNYVVIFVVEPCCFLYGVI
jgi:hypothetical protein